MKIFSRVLVLIVGVSFSAYSQGTSGGVGCLSESSDSIMSVLTAGQAGTGDPFQEFQDSLDKYVDTVIVKGDCDSVSVSVKMKGMPFFEIPLLGIAKVDSCNLQTTILGMDSLMVQFVSDSIYNVCTAIGIEEHPVRLLGAPISLQVSPQPATQQILVGFQLPRQSHTEVSIVSAEGRLVSRLMSKTVPAGFRQVVWNGLGENQQRVTPGTYLVRLKTESQVLVRKAIIVR